MSKSETIMKTSSSSGLKIGEGNNTISNPGQSAGTIINPNQGIIPNPGDEIFLHTPDPHAVNQFQVGNIVDLNVGNYNQLYNPNIGIPAGIPPYQIQYPVSVDTSGSIKVAFDPAPEYISVFTDKERHTDFNNFKLRYALEEGKPIGGLVLNRQTSSDVFAEKGAIFAFGVGDTFNKIHIINKSINKYLFSLNKVRIESCLVEGSETISEEYIVSFESAAVETTTRDFYNTMLEGAIGK